MTQASDDDVRRQVADLVARQQITDVLTRYARGIDRVDLALVESCYHPGAYDEHGDWEGTIEEFLAEAPGFLAQYTSTTHFLGNISIELDGDRARCETYAIAFHRRPSSAGGEKDDVWGVRYLDDFERRNGEWRIAHRRMVRDWRRVDLVPERPTAAGRDAVGRSND